MDGKTLGRLGVALLVAVSLASQSAPARAASVPTGTAHVLVHFAAGATDADHAAAAAAVGGVIESELRGIGVIRIAAPIERASDLASLIAVIGSRPGVRVVEPDVRVHVDFTPNDPLWNTDPYVGLGQWGEKKILLDRALDLVTATTPVTVAVIDTGVDPGHPDLAGVLVPGTTILSSQTTGCNADAIGTDDNSHGTHVAGIIAADSNNGIGIVGIAPNARILPIKALDCTGSGSISDIAQAIIYATDHGARVVNISLGSSSDTATLQAAVQYAISRNVLIVAAAGNCGVASTRCLNTQNLPEYPAAYAGVLAVGATSTDDSIASFSTQGPQLGVSAPGVRIVSTTPHYATYQSDRGGTLNYAAFSGTSQATPFATGLAALVMGMDPTLTATQVLQRLETTADDLGVPGTDPAYGAGRINALRAVTATLPAFGARYDTSAVAKSATAGLVFTPRVTLTNTSPGIWSAGGTNPVHLSYHWLDANGNVVVWDGVRSSLPADVQPGATVAVSATVLAPLSKGAYFLRFDLVKEGVSWFSARGVPTIDVPVAVGSGLGASYATTATTATLVTGAPAPLSVTLINTGTRAWPAAGPNPVHLSYHWLQAGATVLWDGARGPSFAADVQPGQTAVVALPVSPPDQLGAYTLRLDLVQEGVTWFSTEGVPVRDIAYSVTTGYSASYTPVAIPTLLPGERAAVKVGVRNDGIVAWSAAGTNPVHLAAHVADMGGNVLLWDGVRTSFAADVAPGVADSYLVTVDAPLVAGGYRARVDLVREGVSWFSGMGVATGDMPLLVAADYRAGINLGATVSVSRAAPSLAVPIANTSNALWTKSGPGAVHVSVHWYDALGNVLVWDGPRSELPSDMAAGATATVNVALGTPPPGAASLAIDLVSEGVRWFGAGAVRGVTFVP